MTNKITMTKEEFLKQIEKYKWDLNGLVSYLQSDEAKVFSSDSETLLAAIAIHERVFEFASHELKSDKEFVKRVLNEVRVRILRYVSDNLKNDKEVVMAAVSMNGGALQYASQGLKADKEVVAAAIKSSGFALQYASSELQSDVDLICDAYTTHSASLKSVNQNILSSEAFKKKFHSIISKMDKREIKQNFINDIQYIEHLPDHLKNDKELILGLADYLGLALRFVSDELKNDKEIVLKALKTDGLALQYASNNLKNDKDVVLEAIKNGKYTFEGDERGMAIEFASSDLKSDIDVIALAYQMNEKTKQFVSSEIYESSEFKEAFDRISIIEDDQIEFTLIAGNDEQYSNTLNGSAQELNIISFPLSNINVLGEERKFEDFKDDTCWDEFTSYHGSSEEYGETTYYKIKVIRNNKVIVDTNNLN